LDDTTWGFMRPAQRINAGVIYQNYCDDVLVLPSRHHWFMTLPGGEVAVGDRPLLAAQRAVEAQLGLVLEDTAAQALDLRLAKRSEQRPEVLVYLYHGGVLTDEALRGVTRVRYDWAPPNALLSYMEKPDAVAVAETLRLGGDGPAALLRNGEPLAVATA